MTGPIVVDTNVTLYGMCINILYTYTHLGVFFSFFRSTHTHTYGRPKCLGKTDGGWEVTLRKMAHVCNWTTNCNGIQTERSPVHERIAVDRAIGGQQPP